MGKVGNVIAGLDIGTTKVCCIIGEIGAEGQVDVIGIGMSPSKGMRKGVVVNIESTVEAIGKAVEEAELMAGAKISSVFVGITGNHIRGFNSHGIIAIKHNEVSQADLNRVIEAAKAVAMPMDREVLHVLAQEYIIDDQDGIKEPIGMSGVRLESKVHIVTGAASSSQNIIKTVKRAGLEVEDVVLEQLASSEAVLTPDERALGVALVDMGGGTTNIALFTNDSIKFTSVLGVGGYNITNDIAIGLRAPTMEAERIKKRFGCALSALVGEDETIEVPCVGGREPRSVSRKVLSDIIEPRVEELFSLVNREIMKSGYADMVPSGVVLTGGAALMEGMTEVAERIFELPVRKGYPIGIGGLTDVVNSPMFATAVGLLIYGGNSRFNGRYYKFNGKGFLEKMTRKVRHWLGII